MGELVSLLGLGSLGPAIIVLLVLLANCIKRLLEYERGVIFRLGRLVSVPRGPGIILVIPLLEQMVKIDMRTITMDPRRGATACHTRSHNSPISTRTLPLRTTSQPRASCSRRPACCWRATRPDDSSR